MKTVLTTVAAILAVVCLSANANAQSFPSAMCKYYNKQALDTFFTYSGGSAAFIHNSATSAKYVTCPLMSFTNAITSVQIWAEKHTTGSTTCQLYIRTPDFGALTVTNGTAIGTGTGVGSITMTPAGGPISLVGKVANLYCNVQPDRWLYGYTVTP